MDIFLYICNMEDEEGLSDWIEVDYHVVGEHRVVGNRMYEIGVDREILNNVFGIDDPLSAYHKIESVKRLGEIGVHVTFYNRNEIIHNYGK